MRMPPRLDRNCVKKVAIFFFSHVGLAVLVAAYCIMGGFLFQALESPYESKEKLRIKNFKADKTIEILKLAQLYGYKKVDVDNATAVIQGILLQMQEQVTLAVKNNGWNGKDDMDESAIQWSFAGSLLYAVTVVTTIGYGHVAPKTISGRLVTILYALVGIPLTFLYLSNMGNAMAECFRLFYKKVCCIVCIYCGQPKRPPQKKNLEVLTTVRLELASRGNQGFDMDDEYPAVCHPNHRRGSTNPSWTDPTHRRGTVIYRDTPSSNLHGNHFYGERHDRLDTRRNNSGESVDHDHHRHNNVPKEVRFSDLIKNDMDSLDVNNSMESLSVDGARTSEEAGRAEEEGSGAHRLCDKCVDVVRQYLLERPVGTATWIAGDIDCTLKDSGKNPSGGISTNPWHGAASSAHTGKATNGTGFNGQIRGSDSKESPFYTEKVKDSLDEGNSLSSESSDVLLMDDKAMWDAFITSLDYETKLVLDRRKGIPEKLIYRNISVQTDYNMHSTNEIRPDQLSSRDITPTVSSLDESLALRGTRSTDSRVSHTESPRVWREVCRYDPSSFRRRRRRSTLQLQWPKRRDTLTETSSPDGEADTIPAIQPQISSEELDQRRGQLSRIKSTIESELSRRMSTFDPQLLERRRKSSFTMKQRFPGELGDEEREVLYTDAVDTSEEFDQDVNEEPRVTVPITICLIIIAVYIFGGSLLFTIWEDWDYITGSYFCFVTLSTIGFGDIVPGTDMKEGAAHRKFILCSMWLVVGLSLLAMCFNLMQEEVKDKCIWLGRKLGLLKEDNF